MDSFSNWLEILKCRHPTSTNTVNVLNELFSRFGVPKMLVSDDGTQFPGREFRIFYTSLSIDQASTSVYHPRSNRPAERFVHTFKIIKVWKLMRGVYKSFLTVYRITPNPNTDSGLLPDEQLFAKKFDLFSTSVAYSNERNCKKKLLQQNFTNQETEFSSEIIEVENFSWKMKSSLKDLSKWCICSKKKIRM